MSERRLGGRYRLTDQIGAKDHVKTYKAVDEGGAVAAVELMQMPTPEDATRLDRWAETMLGFDHPDLPDVYGYGAEGQSFYVVREYVVGTNLKTLLAGGPLPVERAVRYAIQVSEALHSANRMGLVHGDVRPHNLVVAADDRIKVTEFQMPPGRGGLTARRSDIPEFWHYASPEEIQGLPLAPASDVYSLGAVLYEMVTGRVPFDGETVAKVQRLHLTGAPTPPRSLNMHIPPALDGIILRALAKDPDARYGTFAAMRADLEQVLASQREAGAVLAPPPGVAPVPVRAPAPGRVMEAAPAVVPEEVALPAAPARRRAVWPWVLLAVFLILALAAALVVAFWAQPLALAPIGVPELTGLSQAEARAALATAGLTLGTVANQAAETDQIGTVIAQNPRPAVRVRRGTAVDLTLGISTAIEAPRLTGQTQGEAISTLEKAGLSVGAITFASTSEAPQGTVLGQSPPAGRTLAPGDTIALTVARAPGPAIVPSVIGLREGDAISRLRDAGFSVIATREFSGTIPTELVIRQTPAASTRVSERGTVTIVSSNGPLSIDVPNVVGLTRPDAIATLTRLGLDVVVSFEDTRSALRDRVLAQTPGDDATVAPRTDIRLTVGD